MKIFISATSADLGSFRRELADYFRRLKYDVDFELATRLALESGCEADAANSKINYWACRIESGDIPSPETVLEELERLQEAIRNRQMPMALRKIHLYRGKLKALQWDWNAAAASLRPAVDIDRRRGALYLEEDQQLLDEYLQRCVQE